MDCITSKECPGFIHATNGDMIRRKTDEELAATFLSYRNLGRNVALGDILDWLKGDCNEPFN